MMQVLRGRLRRFRQKVLKQLDMKEQGVQEALEPKPRVPIVQGGRRPDARTPGD